MKYTLEDRTEHARQLRRQGYNCAQSVILCFDDITGLDCHLIASVTSALGTGVAGNGRICGVANAIALTVGATHGSEPSEKITATKEARPLIIEFAEGNDGRLDCRELKAPGNIRPCDELVVQGVEILHRHFAKKENN